jgi:hypothetical protein
MRALLVFALLSATPAFAQQDPFCEELWFTRNAIYDRGGYCFESALGRAVFDNQDCRAGDPALDQDSLNAVARIQQLEQDFACDIDTSARRLSNPGLLARLSLDLIPVPSEYASGCMGYLGAAFPLHAGPSDRSRITGTALPGDDLVFSHEGAGAYSFLDLGNGSMGWARIDDSLWTQCTSTAG